MGILMVLWQLPANSTDYKNYALELDLSKTPVLECCVFLNQSFDLWMCSRLDVVVLRK